VIGKEILWFHAVIWPAMLIALEQPLPVRIHAHSFFIREGQKMSKSLGNFIDMETIDRYVETFGLDAWRHFITKNGPIGTTDADFADQAFIDTYNADLANTLGNCASRVSNMISKYFEGRVPAPNDYAVEGFDWPEAARTAHAGAVAAVERFDLPAAIEAGLDLIRRIDSYIEATQPFKMARDEAQREPLAAVLYNCAEGIRVASMLLYAVIPDKITELWRRMGLDIDPTAGGLEQLARWGQLEPGSPIEKGDPLFPRYQPKK
jgi:methionyl-tRNA synthetase